MATLEQIHSSEEDFLAILEGHARHRWFRMPRSFLQIQKIQKDPAYCQLMTGWQLLDQGKSELAMALLKNATEALPRSLSAWQLYAEGCVANEKYDEAWSAIRCAQDLAGNDFPDALYERFLLTKVVCLHQQERWEEEQTLLLKIAEDQSIDERVRVNAYLRLGQQCEAVDGEAAFDYYVQAAKLPSGCGNVVVWEHLGWACLQQEKWFQARSTFESGIYLRPSTELFIGAAHACNHLSDDSAALYYWAQARRLNARDALTCLSYANTRGRVKYNLHGLRRWWAFVSAWWVVSSLGTLFLNLCMFVLIGAVLSSLLFQVRVLSSSLLSIWVACWPVVYISWLCIGWRWANPRILVLVKQDGGEPGLAWRPLWQGLPLLFRRVFFLTIWGFGFFAGFLEMMVALSTAYPILFTLVVQVEEGLWTAFSWQMLVLLFVAPLYWYGQRQLAHTRFSRYM